MAWPLGFRRRSLLVFLSPLLPFVPAAASGEPAPELAAVALSANAEIVVDGRLDEAVWQSAPMASGFTQREPRAGAPASEATEVRVAFSPTTLYVAVRALDSDPAGLVAREMAPDADLSRDDSVALLFDTFGDRRNGYLFETNLNGARADSLVSDEGEDVNEEWDGVWRVAARCGETGWNAEIAIPFSTLRFAPGAAWGMNVRRLIRRKNEEVYWAPVPLEADLYRVSLAGRLTGLEEIAPGLALQVEPFAVASARERSGSSGSGPLEERDRQTGADLKWGVSRGLSLDLTYQTDFAESEADEQQVNLSRFSLFLPEKRDFFLENAGLFEFGPREWGTPLFRPFFSRRIGLGEDGAPVPLEWGARLSGRSGPWSVGLLGARTGAADRPDGGEAAGPGGDEDWGVLRLKRRVGSEAGFGLMATRRAGAAGENRVLGFDSDWQPTSRFKLRGYWAGSDDPALGSDHAGGIEAAYRGPAWRWNLDAVEIGDGFEPGAGFLLRRGIRSYTPVLTWVPRPKIAGVRNLFFEGRGEVITDLAGHTESTSFAADLFGLRTQRDDAFGVYAETSSERIPELFQIHRQVAVPPGTYDSSLAGIWGETSRARAASVYAWWQRGGFYGGTRTAHGLTLSLRPGRHLRSVTQWDRHDVRLPNGDFATDLLRQRLHVSFTPDLGADALLQHSDSAGLLAMNLRLHWIYRPGADLFLVYNQTWDAPTWGNRRERDRQLILKLTYLFSA